ncbi:MAG: hypothetical protein PWP70_593, partial [Moorella sp. (in: firmicutes)]|nr:hypothetical protein [Moorella sp. (in: firmicutes)]
FSEEPLMGANSTSEREKCEVGWL